MKTDSDWSYTVTNQGIPRDIRSWINPTALGRSWAEYHMYFPFKVSRTLRQYISVVSSHPFCGIRKLAHNEYWI
jgi:hypothetical protein